jgi:hypothetical protein
MKMKSLLPGNSTLLAWCTSLPALKEDAGNPSGLIGLLGIKLEMMWETATLFLAPGG